MIKLNGTGRFKIIVTSNTANDKCVRYTVYEIFEINLAIALRYKFFIGILENTQSIKVVTIPNEKSLKIDGFSFNLIQNRTIIKADNEITISR